MRVPVFVWHLNTENSGIIDLRVYRNSTIARFIIKSDDTSQKGVVFTHKDITKEYQSKLTAFAEKYSVLSYVAKCIDSTKHNGYKTPAATKSNEYMAFQRCSLSGNPTYVLKDGEPVESAMYQLYKKAYAELNEIFNADTILNF